MPCKLRESCVSAVIYLGLAIKRQKSARHKVVIGNVALGDDWGIPPSNAACALNKASGIACGTGCGGSDI